MLVRTVLMHKQQSFLLKGQVLLINKFKIFGRAWVILGEINVEQRLLLNSLDIEIGLQPSTSELKLTPSHGVRLPHDHVRHDDALILSIEVNFKDSTIISLRTALKFVHQIATLITDLNRTVLHNHQTFTTVPSHPNVELTYVQGH